MQEKNYIWHKLADNKAGLGLAPNGMAELEVGGKRICLVVNKDNIHACTAKCPHAGGSLAQGHLDALGNIVCPLHRYKFSLQNGRNTSGEGFYLKTFPIQQRPDGIFVGIEANNLFKWLK
jgi:3-phenylpropionate/trans-cinnamate dioxygenase ferredoxin subunit